MDGAFWLFPYKVQGSSLGLFHFPFVFVPSFVCVL
jgi:hypothetical protein